jgi:insulysin
LFLSSSIDRELQAVHSEFEGNLSQDYRRIWQVQKTTSDPEHPYSKFTTGNIESLRTTPARLGIDLREVLLHFYEKQYSANRMSLAILGNRKYCLICVYFSFSTKKFAESLDVLQSMVVRSFKDVLNKQLIAPQYPADPFGETRCKVDCSIISTSF